MWLLLIFAAIVSAQTTEPLRARMEASIQKQKEAIRKQADTAELADPDWFTVPFSKNKDNQFITKPKALDPPAVASSASASWACPPLPAVSLETPIKNAAARHGLQPGMLRSVIEKESAFHPCAVSSQGAMGLMQLMPATAGELGVRDPFDPVESIEAGAKYLAQLLARYRGDLRLALGAYNAGPARVDQAGGVPPFEETRNYVSSILGAIE